MKRKIGTGLYVIAMLAISIGTVIGFRFGGLDKAWAAASLGKNGPISTGAYISGGATESLSERGVIFYVDIINKGLNFDLNITNKNQYKRLEDFYSVYDRPTSDSSLAIVDYKHDERFWKVMGINKDTYKKYTVLAVGEAGKTDIQRYSSKTKKWNRIIHPYVISGEKTSKSNVYYSELNKLYNSNGGSKNDSTGVNNVLKNWESLVSKNLSGNANKSSQLWAYFTENIGKGDKELKYDINNRINDYILPSGVSIKNMNGNLKNVYKNKAHAKEAYLKYIDYLMTLYTLAKYNKTDNVSLYKAAINKYIEGYDISKESRNNVTLKKKDQYKNVGDTVATGIEIGGYYWVSSDQLMYAVNNIDMLEATMGITKRYDLSDYKNNENAKDFYANDMAKNYALSYKQKPSFKRAFESKGQFASNLVNVFFEKKPAKNNGSTSLKTMTNTKLVHVTQMSSKHWGNSVVVPFSFVRDQDTNLGYRIQAKATWTKYSTTNVFNRIDYYQDYNGNKKIDTNKVDGKLEHLVAQEWKQSGSVAEYTGVTAKNLSSKMIVSDDILVSITGDQKIYNDTKRRNGWKEVMNNNKTFKVSLDIQLYNSSKENAPLKNKKSISIKDTSGKVIQKCTVQDGRIALSEKTMKKLGLSSKSSVEKFIKGEQTIKFRVATTDNTADKLNPWSKKSTDKKKKYSLMVQMQITDKDGVNYISKDISKKYSKSADNGEKWAKDEMSKVSCECSVESKAGDLKFASVDINHILLNKASDKDGALLRDTMVDKIKFDLSEDNKVYEITKYSDKSDDNFTSTTVPNKSIYTGVITCNSSEPAILKDGDGHSETSLLGKTYKYCKAIVTYGDGSKEEFDSDKALSLTLNKERDSNITIDIYYAIESTKQYAIQYYLIDSDNNTHAINSNTLDSLSSMGVDMSTIDLFNESTNNDGVSVKYDNIKLEDDGSGDTTPGFVAVDSDRDAPTPVWLASGGIKKVGNLDFKNSTMESFYDLVSDITSMYARETVPLKPINDGDNNIQLENNQVAEYYKTEYWDSDSNKFVEVVPGTNPVVELQPCSSDGSLTVIPNSNRFKVYYKVNTLKFSAEYTDTITYGGSNVEGEVTFIPTDNSDSKIKKTYPYKYTYNGEDIPIAKTLKINSDTVLSLEDLNGNIVNLSDENSKNNNNDANNCEIDNNMDYKAYCGAISGKLPASNTEHNYKLKKVEITKFDGTKTEINVKFDQKKNPVDIDLSDVKEVKAYYTNEHEIVDLPNFSLNIKATILKSDSTIIKEDKNSIKVKTSENVARIDKLDKAKISEDTIPLSLYSLRYYRSYEDGLSPVRLKADVLGDIMYGFINQFKVWQGDLWGTNTQIPILDPYAKAFENGKIIKTGIAESSSKTVQDRLEFVKYALEKNRSEDEQGVVKRIKELIGKQVQSNSISTSNMKLNKLKSLSASRNIKVNSINTKSASGDDPWGDGCRRIPQLDDFRFVKCDTKSGTDLIKDITYEYNMVYTNATKINKVVVNQAFKSDTHGTTVVKSDSDITELQSTIDVKDIIVSLNKSNYGTDNHKLGDTETYISLIDGESNNCDYKYTGFTLIRKEYKLSGDNYVLSNQEEINNTSGNEFIAKLPDKENTMYVYELTFNYEHSKSQSYGNVLVRHWFYDDISNEYKFLSKNVEDSFNSDVEYTLELLDNSQLSDAVKKQMGNKYDTSKLAVDIDKIYCNKISYNEVNKVTENGDKKTYEFKESPKNPVTTSKINKSFRSVVNADREVEGSKIIKEGTVTVIDVCYINKAETLNCSIKFCIDIGDKCYPVDADTIVKKVKENEEVVTDEEDKKYKQIESTENMMKIYENVTNKSCDKFQFKSSNRLDENKNPVKAKKGSNNTITYHYNPIPPASIIIKYEYLCGCEGSETVYKCVHDGHKVNDEIDVAEELKEENCVTYDKNMKEHTCDIVQSEGGGNVKHTLARIMFVNTPVTDSTKFKVSADSSLNVITVQYTANDMNNISTEYHDFESEPRCYSEVKEGTVLSSADTSNETFEAMAAVPSTETMYFTSGGSEFIMDLYTQYVPDEKAERKYTSKFNGVDCEFKQGDALKGGEYTYSKQETFVANKDDKKEKDTVKAEESHIAKPSSGRLTVDKNEVKDHESDTTFKVEYKGKIENDSSAPSDGLQGYKANSYGSGKCPGVGTDNGNPGTYNIQNAETNWKVSDYNEDLQKAIDYAKEMEKYSDTKDGNIWRRSDSDGKKRVYHVGKAVITVKLDYGDYGADHKQIGTYATGNGETYSTSNVTQAKLKSNSRDRLGIGWCWWDGKNASSYSDYVEGCITCNHNGTTKYKSCTTWISLKATEDSAKQTYDATPSTIQVSDGEGGTKTIANPAKASAKSAWDSAKSAREAHERLADTHKCGDFKDHKSAIELPDTKAVLNKAGSNVGVTGRTGLNQIVGPNNKSSVKDNGDVMTVSAGCAEKEIKYTITVTFKDGYTDGENVDGYANEGTFVKQNTGDSLPAHALCGPCCEHDLPTVQDTWTQELRYSYERINGVRVWKIEKGKLTGLSELQFNGEDSLVSETKQGSPSIFYNIADMNKEYNNKSKKQLESLFGSGSIPSNAELITNAAEAGRIRYTLQSNQLDNVVWNEKNDNGDNKRTDYCDGSSGCGTRSDKNPCIVTSNNGHKNKWSTGILYNNNSFSNCEYWFNSSDVIASDGTPLVMDNNRVDTSTDKIKQNGNYNDKIDYYDSKTLEFNRFVYRRSMLNTAVVVSDTLILQTSTGDQSAMYHAYCQTRGADKNYDYWGSDYEKWKPYKGWTWDTKQKWDWKNGNRVKSEEVADKVFLDNMDALYRTEKNMTEENSYSFCYDEEPWTVMDTINVGSYNGKAVSDRNKKFSGTNKKSINTVFDADGLSGNNTINDPIIGKITFENEDNLATVSGKGYSDGDADSSAPVKMQRRKARTSRLRIWNPLELDSTITNNKYTFDNSVVYYKPILDYTRSDIENGYTINFTHTSENTEIVGENGLEYNAPYIDGQVKTNSIVIYDPIGINAGLVGLSDEDDQRTDDSVVTSAKKISSELAEEEVCPGVPSLCEFRVLDCKYTKDNDLARFDFNNPELSSEDGDIPAVVDSINGYRLDIDGGSELREQNKDKGEYDLEFTGDAISMEYSGVSIVYSTDLKLEVGMDLQASTSVGDRVMCALGNLQLVIPSGKTYPIIRANLTDLEDEDGNDLPDVTIERKFKGATITGDKYKSIKVLFDVNNINNCKVYVDNTEYTTNKVEDADGYYRLGQDVIGDTFYIGDANNSTSSKFYIDNLYITRKAGSLEHTDACYVTNIEHSGGMDYSKSDCNKNLITKFEYTGNVQKFVAPETGDYKLEAYGAQGGGNDIYKSSHGGLGGYSSGVVHLEKDQEIYVYVGGQGEKAKELSVGTQHNGGGYNGGGNGSANSSASGYGGGGMTHFSLVGTDKIASNIKKEETIINTNARYTGSTSFTDRHGVLAKEFTAKSNGTIKFYSTSHSADPYGHIYVNGSLVVSNDDGAGNLDFLCTTTVKAGDVVQLYAGAYSGAGSCSWVCEFTSTNSSGYTVSWLHDNSCSYSGAGQLHTFQSSTATPSRCEVCQHSCGAIASVTSNVQKEVKITEVDDISFNTNACLLVAGGGGGSDNTENEKVGSSDDGSGGAGGGVTAGNPYEGGKEKSGYAGTQNSGYKQGLGQSATIEKDSGGAGGGWYGGKSTNNCNGGAGGGSAYYKKGTVSYFETSQSMREGNGYAVVTLLTHEHTDDCLGEHVKNNVHEHTESCIDMKYLKAILVKAEDKDSSTLKSVVGSKIYSYIESQGYLDRNESGYNSALSYIKQNIDKIDIESELFNCTLQPNKHECNEDCKKVKKLICSEPHHSRGHYDTSNTICYSACNKDENHKTINDTIKVGGNKVQLGSYLNLDKEFEVVYYNYGQYYQTRALGIADTQLERGVGFGYGENEGFDTTKWTREKKIKFNFDVLFYRDTTNDGIDNGEWEQYNAGTWIPLPVTDSRFVQDTHKSQAEFANAAITKYKFYALLENSEISMATLEYKSESINNRGSSNGKEKPYERTITREEGTDKVKNIDGNTVDVTSIDVNESDDTEFDRVTDLIYTNKVRDSYYKNNHGAYSMSYADIVGRIGNLLLSDTDDLRYCNLFKEDTEDNDWIVEGVIHKVLTDVQKSYLSWHKNSGGYAVDVRNEQVSKDKGMYNTWYNQSWTEAKSIDSKLNGTSSVALPLSGDKNSIEQLKNENLRLGYNVYGEITTMGNYYNSLQIVPYFYALNLDNGEVTPVDVYMTENDSYKAINLFDAVNDPTWNSYNTDGTITENNIQRYLTDYRMKLNWQLEKARRNYGRAEKWITNEVASAYGEDIPGTEHSETVIEYKRDDNGVISEFSGSAVGSTETYSDAIQFDSSTGEEIGNKTVTIHTIEDTNEMYQEGKLVYFDYSGTRREVENPIVLNVTHTDNVKTSKQLDTPDNYSKEIYTMGTMQVLKLGGNARTFIGSAYTQNVDLGKNLKDQLNTSTNGLKSDGGSSYTNIENEVHDMTRFWKQAQRWHFTMGLPTSATFVKTTKDGNTYTHCKSSEEVSEKSTEIKKGNYVILMTADIKSFGEVWNLKYDQGKDNGKIEVNGRTYTFTSDDIPTLIAVYSVDSNQEDIDIKSSH